jgi:F0F1-type ATP synthase assembly protein I
MVPNSSNRGDFGRYLAIGQVGLEMVIPIGVGVMLDRWLGWQPWGVVGGAVLGLTLGLVRLVRLANKEEPRKPPANNKPEA